MELVSRLTGSSSSPSGRLRRRERLASVQAALARLSEADREVLVLRYLEDLSTREIAAVMNVTESAVKMRQLRALRRLRDLLPQRDSEDLA